MRWSEIVRKERLRKRRKGKTGKDEEGNCRVGKDSKRRKRLHERDGVKL